MTEVAETSKLESNCFAFLCCNYYVKFFTYCAMFLCARVLV